MQEVVTSPPEDISSTMPAKEDFAKEEQEMALSDSLYSAICRTTAVVQRGLTSFLASVADSLLE